MANGRERVGRALCACGAMLLASCTNYPIERIDYKSQQKPAAILIGDPQVYKRASLINDRRREIEHLQQLLANSSVDANGQSKVSFPPQLVRELKIVEAVNATLATSRGRVGQDQSTAADLSRQIEVANLRAQLALREKQLDAIAAAALPSVTIPAPEFQSSAGGTATPVVAMPDVTALQVEVKQIQAQLAELAKGPSPATAPNRSYAGLEDPRSDLEDRQGYRRDIRALLSAAQLDDAHDRAGNALFRLQFQVTVLPPNDESSQWGAAKLQVKAPQLTASYIESMYFQWLGHISGQLTESALLLSARGVEAEERANDYARYINDFARLGYLRVIDVFQDPTSGHLYCLNRDAGSTVALKELSSRYQVTRPWSGTFAVPPNLMPVSECTTYTGINTNLTMPMTATVAQQIINWVPQRYVPSTTRREGDRLSSLQYRDPPRPSQLEAASTGATRRWHVPTKFCEAVVATDARKSCAQEAFQQLAPDKTLAAAAGSVPGSSTASAIKSYSVLPAQLSQRVGVTSEASQSLQVALAVAAQMSTAKVGDASFGYLQQSNARGQAINRQPVVVGFAGSDAGAHEGFFGWLFGPEFSTDDPQRLKLRQNVRNYGVTADVSIPGWWPYVGVESRSVWVSNWSEGSFLKMDRDSSAQTTSMKQVSLPDSIEMYEALTSHIAAIGSSQDARTYLLDVSPNLIPACSSSITLRLDGVRIWRADAVFLGGVKASSVNVLPDMRSIAATFNLDDVYGKLVQSGSLIQAVPISVITDHRAQSLYVWLAGRRQSANGVVSACSSPVAVASNVRDVIATVTSVTPTEVCTDATSVALMVEGINLPEALAFSGLTSAAFEHERWVGDWTRRLLTMKLKKGVKLKPGVQHIALTYVDRGHPSSKDDAEGGLAFSFGVKDCSSENATLKDAKPVPLTLETSNVKLAKDQQIKLKGLVPTAYAEVVIGVRPQVKSGEQLEWKASAPIKPAPGESSEISATMDLSGLASKPGERLQVVVRTRSRPEAAYQDRIADKTLLVVAQ